MLEVEQFPSTCFVEFRPSNRNATLGNVSTNFFLRIVPYIYIFFSFALQVIPTTTVDNYGLVEALMARILISLIFIGE